MLTPGVGTSVVFTSWMWICLYPPRLLRASVVAIFCVRRMVYVAYLDPPPLRTVARALPLLLSFSAMLLGLRFDAWSASVPTISGLLL